MIWHLNHVRWLIATCRVEGAPEAHGEFYARKAIGSASLASVAKTA